MAKGKTTENASEVQAETVKSEVTYSKSQILKSEAYQHRKDLVNALLVDGKAYTKNEVNQLIDDFMKGKVN